MLRVPLKVLGVHIYIYWLEWARKNREVSEVHKYWLGWVRKNREVSEVINLG